MDSGNTDKKGVLTPITGGEYLHIFSKCRFLWADAPKLDPSGLSRPPVGKYNKKSTRIFAVNREPTKLESSDGIENRRDSIFARP